MIASPFPIKALNGGREDFDEEALFHHLKQGTRVASLPHPRTGETQRLEKADLRNQALMKFASHLNSTPSDVVEHYDTLIVHQL